MPNSTIGETTKMKSSTALRTLVLFILTCSHYVIVCAQEPTTNPDIILIYTDDQGFGDCSALKLVVCQHFGTMFSSSSMSPFAQRLAKHEDGCSSVALVLVVNSFWMVCRFWNWLARFVN